MQESCMYLSSPAPSPHISLKAIGVFDTLEASAAEHVLSPPV